MNHVLQLSGLLFLMVVYFIPSLIAHNFQIKQRLGIYVLNFFMGFTLFGWVASFVWAVSGDQEIGAIKIKDYAATHKFKIIFNFITMTVITFLGFIFILG